MKIDEEILEIECNELYDHLDDIMLSIINETNIIYDTIYEGVSITQNTITDVQKIFTLKRLLKKYSVELDEIGHRLHDINEGGDYN